MMAVSSRAELTDAPMAVCLTGWFIKEHDFTPRKLTKPEWAEHYRKGKLSEKEPNIRANIILLSLYVLPIMSTTYRKWGANKTQKRMSDVTRGSSEAWVFMMAREGHLDSKAGKKHMSTRKDCEEFVSILSWLQTAREDNETGKAWDETLMEMAVCCKKEEENANEEALQKRRQNRLAHLAEEDREELEQSSKRRKKKKLVIPRMERVPVSLVTTLGTVSHSDISESSASGGTSHTAV